TLCDLRRDNCHSEAARRRLEAICNRRQLLEARLRTHYPNLHNGDSLFPEFDSQNFSEIGHRGYARLVRELQTLQNRLYDCTKFEKLIRYRCANLVFIVLPEQLFRESEVPVGWGALVESNDTLTLVRKPIWHDATAASRIHVLHRIAVVGTRNLSRELSLDWHEQIVPGHFFWLRQAEQKQKSRRHIRQNAVFAAELRRIVGNTQEVHKVAGMRGVWRAVRVAHLLAVAVVR